MKDKTGLKKYENCILTFAVVAAGVVVMGICFDFYYDLNDDTMMRDIMSGAYSGTPDGHNMQTLYPLGALIALCYRMCGGIPWYGLFLGLCQFGCFYLVGVRLCAMTERKLVSLVVLTIVQWGVCLPHLISIQYTVTCAMMSAAAIFLFVTTPEKLTLQQFVVKNIPSVLLIILAFQLRTEMLLLTFPFICLAGLYRMTEEKEMFAKESLGKYGVVLGMILTGMLLSVGADAAAYSSAEWRDFRDFFDARTTVYDFYPELITDEKYGAELAGLGVTAEQRILLDNYNFGLDDRIDTGMLEKLADYASETIGGSKDWAAALRGAASNYVYRTFPWKRTAYNITVPDAPYNIIVLWAYAAVIVTGMCACRQERRKFGRAAGEMKSRRGAERTRQGWARRYAFVWQIALLAAVRSAVWMFILVRGRYPARITHSLYIVELMLLWALLARKLSSFSADMKRNGIWGGLLVLFALTMAGSLKDNISEVRADQARREWVNEAWYDIDDYCRAHGENFYLEDVYSTVAFSQKIFDGRDNSYANYDIMGGWMCKSPLYYDKLARRDIDSVQEALAEGEKVYLIMSGTEAAGRGTGWVVEHYGAQGVAVGVEKTDDIGASYSVYRVYRE